MILRADHQFKWAMAIAVAATFCVAFAMAPAAQAAGSFSLSGNAQRVVGGTGANNAAVDLTSDCTTSPAPCGFSPTSSDVDFTPDLGLTFGAIATLSSDYNVGASDCGGGSPRFTIHLSTGKNVFVYFGPAPISNPGNCFFGWQTTGNVIGMNDGRWDTSQICPGTQINTYTGALSCVSSGAAVTSVSIDVDAGWTATRGQDVTVDNFTVNDSVMNGANVH